MSRLSFLAALSCLVGLSSCFVVTDLDRFEKAPALTPSNFSSLHLTVRGMTSHVAERFEYRIVDATNVIQARGLITPLGGPDATITIRGAVPKQNGPFRLDFFADHDNSGAYDPRPDTTLDHSWRLMLEDRLLTEQDTYEVLFDHNTSFTNLNNPVPATEYGKPATIHIRDTAAFQGKRLEVRIQDKSTKRTPAVFRVPSLNAFQLDAYVAGMMERDVVYLVEVYTDDGKSTRASIKAWRFETTCTEAGVEALMSVTNPLATPGAVEVLDAEPPPTL